MSTYNLIFIATCVCSWEACGEDSIAIPVGETWARDVAFSPNGEFLAVSAAAPGRVKLHDATTGRIKRSIKVPSDRLIGNIAFSPDGTLLALASGSKIHVCEVESGKQLRVLADHDVDVFCMSFSPDGRRLASGASEGGRKVEPELFIWNIKEGRVETKILVDTDYVLALAFAPNGETLATGGGDLHGKAELKLWEISSGKAQGEFVGHSEWVGAVAFSPNGDELLSGSGDKTVRLWDVRSLRQQWEVRAEMAIGAVAFSPTGDVLASDFGQEFMDGTIKLRDTTGREIGSLDEHDDEVYSLAFSPDGKSIASASRDKTIRLWPVPSVP